MSVQTEARLTIGWRVETKCIPDAWEREFETHWFDLLPLVDRACITLSENLYHEDLCDVEREDYGDTYIIGVPAPKREMPIDKFMADMDARAKLAREVYEQVMREEPKDGPYMISWKKVW